MSFMRWKVNFAGLLNKLVEASVGIGELDSTFSVVLEPKGLV